MGAQEDRRPLIPVMDEEEASGPTWERLEDQLTWYDRKSVSAQAAFKRAKVAELVVATAIPVMAGTGLPPFVIGLFGAVIVILEGLQHLYQWQQNWVLYRSTAEALKHERYLFLAEAGPYTGPDRMRVLAERLEGLVSQEHARWTEARERLDKEKADSE